MPSLPPLKYGILKYVKPGILEHWNAGILGKTPSEISFRINPLFHSSTIPLFQD
jgi:hypothetical protein